MDFIVNSIGSAVLLLSVLAATSGTSTHVNPMTVLAPLEERGFTSEGLTSYFVDGVRRISLSADSIKTNALEDVLDTGLSREIANYFSLATILKDVRRLAGLVDYEIWADLVEREGTLMLDLRIEDVRRKVEHRVARTGTIQDPRRLLDQGVVALLETINPYLLALHAVRTGAPPEEVDRLLVLVDGFYPYSETYLVDNLAGIAAQRRGDLVGARRAFERSLRTAPTFGLARLNLAAVLIAQGHLDAARNEIAVVLAEEPAWRAIWRRETHGLHADAVYLLGQAAVRAGDAQEAERRFREAARVEPQLGPAHQALARLLRQRGLEAYARYHERVVGQLDQTEDTIEGESLLDGLTRQAVKPAASQLGALRIQTGG